jgi:hypothetical protein
MEFNATIDLIIKDLDEARKIIDDLKNYPGVPVLQVELAKSKCKSAGEVISLLKNPGDNMPLVAERNPPLADKKEEPKTNKEKVSESSIIADKFSHLSNRFNEQLAGLKSDDDVSDILKTKQLTNLSDAIGVNDKFLFIREIFDGNKDAYTKAISRLDSAENLTDARAVIMSYTGNDIENETVKQLLDLVKRKFLSNE